MKKSPLICRQRAYGHVRWHALAIGFAFVLLAAGVDAQSPWERAATTFANSMTGTIARAACVICAVLAGIGLSTGEPGAARRVAYLCAGISLAIGAANFVTWIGG
jgi:type IV secretory pathway VirB2 component (pilin)